MNKIKGVFGKNDDEASKSQVTPSSSSANDAPKKEESKGGDAEGSDSTATVEKKSDANHGEICQMKRGDYMIHIYIEQAKDLKVDAEDTVDPIIQIECMGNQKFTTALDDINNTGVAIWNEHIFFEPKNKEVEELAEGKITIKMMDKGFFKDSIIGYYEFDLSYIYQMQDHCMMHKWIVMSNPEDENYGEVTAMLKMSISICGEGDEQAPIDDDPNPEKEDVLQPPQVKPEFYQLKFRFFGAQKIVPMDTVVFGDNKLDAFVQLDYKTQKLKSKVLVQKEGGEIHWNQEFLVPAQIPIIGGRLIFKIMDEDVVKDELVGSIHFNIKEVLEQYNGKMNWKNVYGCPEGVSGHNSDRMNANPEIASWWKGRVLVQCLAEKTEKPLLKVERCPDDAVEIAKEYFRPRRFAISLFIAGAYALPYDNKEYQVCVRIAEKEWSSGAPLIKKVKYNRFNCKPTENDGELVVPYYSIEDIGTVFVYLKHKYKIGGEKRICFWRGHIDQFMNPNPELQWLELEPDLAIGEIKEHYKGGLVGIKLSVHDIEQDGPANWNKYPQWTKKISKRPPNIKVRIYCWQARDLPAADETGSSDPFLVVTDCDSCQKTQVIWDNVNPLFYEGLEACFEANSMEELPPLVIDLFDKDATLVGKDDEDFLSRAVLYIKDIEYAEDNTILKPKWYPLYWKKGGALSGEVLLSFAIVADDFPFKKTLKKLHLEREVEMKEFKVSMNILGLRGLQSAGVLPVKKAFIQFNLRSMVPPALGTNLENLKTEPKQPGTDPTLNTLIEFNAPLPRDKLFCPRLSCSVFDNVAMGFSQPLIGTFVIPIGDLMHELAEERIRETEQLEYVVSEVKKMVGEEFLVASRRSQLKASILEEERKQEEELEKVRVNKKFREQLAKKMNATAGTSINSIQEEDYDEPLLEGDHDEEVRQSERLQQKEKNAVEGGTRLDSDLVMKMAAATGSRTNSMQYRTYSNRSQPDTPTMGGIKKFDPKLKQALIDQQNEEVEKAKRDVAEAREKALQQFKNTSNVQMPKYKRDEHLQVDREFDCPPETLFIGLGWDEDAETGRRHYRRYYPDELENVTEVMGEKPSVFNSYDLKRGQTRGAKVSLWAQLTNQVKTDASGAATNEKMTGRFKAVIQVEAREVKAAYEARKKELINELTENLKELAKNRHIEDFDLDLTLLDSIEGGMELKLSLEPLGVNHLKVVKCLADIESDEILKRMLLIQKKMIVRVYMIEGFDLASRDLGSESDPYLKIKCGNKLYDERDNYQMDERNPKFHKMFDFNSLFPGCPMLFIDAYDYDDLFGDDLIGSTFIDLEDRYFLPEWRCIKNKPVEYRQLYHPSSAVSQGQLKLWVEINEAEARPEDQERLWNISPKPPTQMTLRLCIFKTKEIKMMDDEGTSDVYIRAFFDSRKDALETDTHYRCQTGEASFNYRLLYNIEHPRKDYRFTVQAYDRDFFKSNDVIGSIMFDLKVPFHDVDLTKRPLLIGKKYYNDYMRKEGEEDLEWDDEENFWLPMNSKNEKGEMECNGYVMMRMDIVTTEYGEKNPVGSGRDEPNHEPYLPPPIGRISFSLNPCTMYKQLIGPAMRRKICIWCTIIICTLLCILIAYYVVPVVIGDLISKGIGKMF